MILLLFLLWNSTGDSSIKTSSFGINPTEGFYQGLITTQTNAVSDSQVESFLGIQSGQLDSLTGYNAVEGSAFSKSITVEAGDTLTFNWNFLTDERAYSYYNDFAFVAISHDSGCVFGSDSLTKLADTYRSFSGSPATTGFSKQSGNNTFAYTFATSGTYNVGIGVMDSSDIDGDSALLVDNLMII